MIGKQLSAVRDQRPDMVLGIVHEGRFVLGIGENPIVGAGDRLLIAQPAPEEAEQKEPLAASAAGWAGLP